MHIKLMLNILFVILSLQSTNIKAGVEESVSDSIKVSSSVYELGYQIGDIVHQRVNIVLPRGYQLDEGYLPAKGKGSTNIELKALNWQVIHEAKKSYFQLDFEWQVFRVMLETRAYSLRPLNLRFNRIDSATSGLDKVITVDVKPARVLVSSVLPTTMDDHYVQLREDVAPEGRYLTQLWLIVISSILVLAMTSLYFVWHYDWVPSCIRNLFSSPKPYKKAHREIASLMRNSQNEEGLVKAIRSFRRACDETAGLVITAEKSNALFNRHAWLSKHIHDIQSFYTYSDAILFAGSHSSTNLNIEQLMKLSRQLMLLESK